MSLPSNNAAYRRGLGLFNHGEFYDAHEVLEDVWRAAPEPERLFLQGLIQTAVGLHHHSRGNVVGCRSLLDRASRNLRRYPEAHEGVNLDALLRDLALWIDALDRKSPVPPLPKLELSR